ncbi:carboxypeptidase O-like isoform X2 [Rhinatrema bivittatum]|nr:carboxypeptidase O-like isoform X2 [Rhinatrema bivittatum]
MEDIYQWMNQIKEEYSHLVTQNYLGATYESRPMYFLKISQPSDKPKKIIWMDCGIHAREWISPSFCQWFVKEILKSYQSNPKLSKAIQNIDFYVLPVLNIDGYVYSWTTDRLWRKSRSPHDNGTCYGTDLNRNFNAQWCTVGADSFCSSEAFCGTSPDSEPETKAITSFIESQKSDILCYLSIHSFGQFILIPYGYSVQPASNHDELMKVAETATAALKEKHGTDFEVGPFSTVLYKASGTSQDWVYDLGINLSFTLELRDNGTFAFELPEDQIQSTCEETMAAVMTIIEYVDEKYFKNNAVTVTSSTLWLSILLSASRNTA